MQINEPIENIIKSIPNKDKVIPEALNQYFDNLRQHSDDVADSLVEKTLFPSEKFSGKSQHGFNHLLDIADALIESPEIALNANSELAKNLNDYPDALRDYFDPMIAPDWVDEKKLVLASQLWQQDMMSIISTLYSVSLPSCYLMKNEVLALYDTSKLGSKEYVYQRIYETGLMLDAVLAPDGIQLADDIVHSHDTHIIESLNREDPEGKWVCEAGSFTRTGGSPTQQQSEFIQNLLKSNVNVAKHKPKRYMWGKGYVTAKKVRFLHAAMRYMLLHPEAMKRSESAEKPTKSAFDAAAHGVPINQEDLAYTILTFGYCIPKGLEKLGRFWTKEEKEAFLHLWKTVGYTMGIQENLLVDNWDDAEKLFTFIQRRQAGETEEAKTLTKTLVYFFEDYLPKTTISRGIATRLITNQLGDAQAKMVLPEDYIKESQRMPVRIIVTIAIMILWLYYRVRKFAYQIPLLKPFFRRVFHKTGVEFINSWRDVYSRKPFYIPISVDSWKRKKGINEPYLENLSTWRQALFNSLLTGLACIIASGISVILSILFFFFSMGTTANVVGWLGAILGVAGILILGYQFVKVSKSRPKLGET